MRFCTRLYRCRRGYPPLGVYACFFLVKLGELCVWLTGVQAAKTEGVDVQSSDGDETEDEVW